MDKFLKSLRREEKGITGLETAIILIAFVVVAAVLAYTVLSAGLFATQKSQESVYSGLKESQSSMEVKGGVVATGKATIDNMDYTGWVAGTHATLTRETSTKWEGSGSLKAVIVGGLLNETQCYHEMQAVNFTTGDTITFWIKTDANLQANLTFALATGIDLQGTSTQTSAITTTTTGWEKKTVTIASDSDSDTAVYFGIYLAGADAGTFYLDKVVVDSVAAYGGAQVLLDSSDYYQWVADAGGDVALTRETTEKIEGSGSLKAVMTVAAADLTTGDEVMYRALQAKDWTIGDTITFWTKASGVALNNAISFHLATGTDLSGTATQSYTIPVTGTGWEKKTVTISDNTASDTAVYFGFSVAAAPADGAYTIYVDCIQTNAKLNLNADPMKVYANQVVFTVSNTLGGEAVDFTTTTDSDNDGIISDETKHHKVIVSYSDQYQTVSDLAWSYSSVGTNDGDNLLEANEKFQVTVDLTYINNNAGWDFKKTDANHTFTIELKPPSGGILNIERTLPALIKDVNNLN